MACLTKDGDSWKAQVCLSGVRKMKRHDTKAQEKSWAAQMEVELGKMAQGVSSTHSFSDVFNRYANEVSDTKKGAQWEIVRLKMFALFQLRQ